MGLEHILQVNSFFLVRQLCFIVLHSAGGHAFDSSTVCFALKSGSAISYVSALVVATDAFLTERAFVFCLITFICCSCKMPITNKT